MRSPCARRSGTCCTSTSGSRPTLRRSSCSTRTGATGGLSVRFARDGTSHLAADGSTLDGALGRILAVVYSAMVAGTWTRLKACPRDVCGWIFYDRSRNSSSRWCAMSVCGNRTKTKRFRAQAVAR